ncbi:MAG: DUF1826 domain-containing protein [Pikeienuella sp.]
MSVARRAETDGVVGSGAGVSVTEDPEGLSEIHDDGCDAVIWRRDPLPSFQPWVDALKPEQLPKARVILRPDATRSALREICQTSGTPDCEDRDRLIDDVAALSERFAGLMEAPYLRLRLDVITTNACRRFHIDSVTARLICTYRGTGTQYGLAVAGAEPDPILTVPTGAPILLRGTLWPGQAQSGLLHRSPPIAGTGETRLVLVLDPILNLEDAPDRDLMH